MGHQKEQDNMNLCTIERWPQLRIPCWKHHKQFLLSSNLGGIPYTMQCLWNNKKKFAVNKKQLLLIIIFSKHSCWIFILNCKVTWKRVQRTASVWGWVCEGECVCLRVNTRPTIYIHLYSPGFNYVRFCWSALDHPTGKRSVIVEVVNF